MSHIVIGNQLVMMVHMSHKLSESRINPIVLISQILVLKKVEIVMSFFVLVIFYGL